VPELPGALFLFKEVKTFRSLVNTVAKSTMNVTNVARSLSKEKR